MKEGVDCLAIQALSDSQKMCLRLVSAGYTSKEIARQTGLTAHTVDQYMSRAVAVLGVESRREAARLLAEVENDPFNQFEFNSPRVAPTADVAPILDAARLTTSVMETKQGAAVSPGQSQKVLDSLTAGMSKIVDGRRDMVSAHRSLVVIKGESNLDVEDYGCFTVDANAAQEPVRA